MTEKHDFIPASELVLNNDGSVFHLHLKPEHVADTVLLVGDQSRVEQISKHFDTIEVKIQNREFITHTGTYKGTRLTVLSTGIGTDNIDIAVNELDAAVNVDLEKRQSKSVQRSLNLIRIGTSGALHADIPVGSFVASTHGLGFDGLIHFYSHTFSQEEQALEDKVNKHLNWNKNLSRPYIVEASGALMDRIGYDMVKGITATASGFYGPQGRSVRLKLQDDTINERLQAFSDGKNRITNFEMETSALYGLGKILGHQCFTTCAIIANRVSKEYSKDYKKDVERLIITVLDRLS